MGGSGAISIYGFTGGEDSIVDSYLVGSGPHSISFNPEPGAVSYGIAFMDDAGYPGVTLCSEYLTSSPAYLTCSSSLISDGTQYRAVISSFNSSGSQISQAESWFWRVTEVPWFNFVAPLTCNNSSAGSLIIEAQSNDYAVSMGITSFSWNINYNGGSSGSSGLGGILAGSPVSMLTDIVFSNAGNPTSINHSFTLNHVSGYSVNYVYTSVSTYDGAGACSP